MQLESDRILFEIHWESGGPNARSLQVRVRCTSLVGDRHRTIRRVVWIHSQAWLVGKEAWIEKQSGLL